MIPLNVALNNGLLALPGTPASIDFETRSEVDIKSAGARRYAQSSTTDVLCLAIKIGPAEAIWAPGYPMPTLLAEAIERGEFLAAWHASFEIAIWQEIMVPRYGWPDLPVERFKCTMQRAAIVGCPGALEKAAAALRLPVQKDMEGHRLMMKMCKPLPERKGDAPGTVRWHDDPADHLRLQEYCMGDVRTEALAASYLPEPPPMEVAVMRVDRYINMRGVTIDKLAAEGAAKIARVEKARLNGEMKQITNGTIGSTNQVAAILEFIGRRGVIMDKLRAADVRAVLADEDDDESSSDLDVTDAQIAAYGAMDPIAKRVLELRAEASKASTAKLDALVKGTLNDGRMVDLFAYSGAYRTSRWCLPAYTPVTILRSGQIRDVPIVDVQITDKVWDGSEWVAHEGVVYSGMKPVIRHDGVVATKDHVVYVSETDSLTLAEVKERGLRIWTGRNPVLDIHADRPEREAVHRVDKKGNAVALAVARHAHEKASQTASVVRHHEKVRIRYIQGENHNASQGSGSGTQCRDVRHQPIPTGVQSDRGWRDRFWHWGAQVLGVTSHRPETQSRVLENTIGGVSEAGSGAARGGGKSARPRAKVAGGEPSVGVLRLVPSDADGRSGERPSDIPRPTLLQVYGAAVDADRQGHKGAQVLRQQTHYAGAVGYAGPDPAEREYIEVQHRKMGAAVRGREGRTAGAACAGAGGTVTLGGSEGATAGRDTALLGGQTHGEVEPTFDIINAGPRNRFRAWGRIVSNSGRRAQLQNLPRANPPCETEDEIETWYDALRSGDHEYFTTMLPKGMSVMDGLKSSLRGFITASKGRMLNVADLSQIEARGVAWAAGQWDVIEAFERLDDATRAGADEATIKSLDIYTVTGKKMGADRQGGKVGVLGCGFGAGKHAIALFAAGYGLTWDEQQAEQIVDAWRSANPMVVKAWGNEERAAKEAMANPGTVVQVGDGRSGSYCYRNGNLLTKLPSGRVLVYRNMKIEPRMTPWGQNRMTLTYEANNFAKGRPGEFSRLGTHGGKLFQNRVQAFCRDILAVGLIRAERAGLQAVFHVHDEQGVDSPTHLLDVESDRLVRAMTDPIPWVEGLPIMSSADVSFRYRKN